jgi:uncharacterized protein YdhG (YjbR/CyaY superfamily)
VTEAKKTDATRKAPARGTGRGFSAEERAAMKEYAKELRSTQSRAEAEASVREKIAEMEPGERAIAERFDALVRAVAPELAPKLWYGMPAYARDGQVVCFFQPASKFKGRYSTIGFNGPAKLDDGTMWATSFAVTALSDADEEFLRGLVKKAVG